MKLKKILLGLTLLSASAAVYAEGEKIRFTFDNKEIVVALEDNSGAESLLKQLPLTLKFEDYSSTEKISYPPEKLDISRAPKSCTPKRGDLTYYSPWGNLAFFYRDFRHSNGLVPLGRIESGIEALEELDRAASVKIEKVTD